MSWKRTSSVCIVVLSLAMLLPPAEAGPFPESGPIDTLLGVTRAEAEDTLAHTTAITRASYKAGVDVVNKAQHLGLANSSIERAFAETGEHGAAMVYNSRDMGLAAIGTTGHMAQISVGYGNYLALLAQQRAGVQVSGDAPPVATLDASCFPVTVLDKVLAEVAPGSEIPVCAGTYEGDLVIDTEFVTLRSVQGPYATTLAGSLEIAATGVTVSGFSITDGGVVIGGAGDGYLGEIWGTLLYGNLIYGNSIGVQVGHAEATLLVANTFRANGVGVQAAGIEADADAEPAAGVVLVANNLVKNGRYAVQITGGAGVPVVSLADHFGELTPSVALTEGLCVGAGVTDTRCRNAVSAGVVVLAPVPVAYPGL